MVSRWGPVGGTGKGQTIQHLCSREWHPTQAVVEALIEAI
jgi:phage tail protein X